MRWWKRIGLAVAALVGLAMAAVAASSLLSLDWSRSHTAATAALPRVSGALQDGLVQIDARGMTFRARVAGAGNTGAGVILLHGFPETSAMWGPLLDAVAGAGHRVVGFDQRGYSPGARPEGVEAYLVPELVADVTAIADAVGFERFHLVGHDWGCIVGWSVVISHPERVLTWSGLSIPHPGTLLANLREELPAYIRVFTAPLVPETLLSVGGLANLRESYPNSTDAQRAEYVAVFSEPGALTGALDWYRAITLGLDGPDAGSLEGPVATPTLFLWGEREGWVTDEALARQRELVIGPYEELEVDAAHFVMQQQPAQVTEAVLAHIARGPER